MRIALLQSPTFPLNIDYHGGIERAELGELGSLTRAGHEVTLFVPRLIGSHPNITTIPTLGWKHRLLKWAYYIFFILAARKYQIFHGHFTPLLALFAPRKSVIHFHGTAIFSLPLFQHSFFRKRYLTAYYVFCSRWLAKAFTDRYSQFPASHVQTIYYGCDIIDHFKSFPHRSYDGEINICWYSLWEEPKGIFDFLRAMELLGSTHAGFTASIGGSSRFEGDRSDADEIDRQVREAAGRLSFVNLVGPIKHADLPVFLSHQHIGVFNPTCQEPFGLVGLEMMASGQPVIAYDHSGPAEYIQNGRNGFLVENRRPDLIASALANLLDNRPLIAEMARTAHTSAAHFTWSSHVDSLIKVYDAVLATHRGDPRGN